MYFEPAICKSFNETEKGQQLPDGFLIILFPLAFAGFARCQQISLSAKSENMRPAGCSNYRKKECEKSAKHKKFSQSKLILSTNCELPFIILRFECSAIRAKRSIFSRSFVFVHAASQIGSTQSIIVLLFVLVKCQRILSLRSWLAHSISTGVKNRIPHIPSTHASLEPTSFVTSPISCWISCHHRWCHNPIQSWSWVRSNFKQIFVEFTLDVGQQLGDFVRLQCYNKREKLNCVPFIPFIYRNQTLLRMQHAPHSYAFLWWAVLDHRILTSFCVEDDFSASFKIEKYSLFQTIFSLCILSSQN